MAAASKEFGATPTKIRAAIRTVVASLGWKIKAENDQLIEAGAPTSLASWGEKIEIRVAKGTKGNTVVTVASDAPSQLFAWGKNDENVASFLERLEKAIG